MREIYSDLGAQRDIQILMTNHNVCISSAADRKHYIRKQEISVSD